MLKFFEFFEDSKSFKIPTNCWNFTIVMRSFYHKASTCVSAPNSAPKLHRHDTSSHAWINEYLRRLFKDMLSDVCITKSSASAHGHGQTRCKCKRDPCRAIWQPTFERQEIHTRRVRRGCGIGWWSLRNKSESCIRKKFTQVLYTDIHTYIYLLTYIHTSMICSCEASSLAVLSTYLHIYA